MAQYTPRVFAPVSLSAIKSRFSTRNVFNSWGKVAPVNLRAHGDPACRRVGFCRWALLAIVPAGPLCRIVRVEQVEDPPALRADGGHGFTVAVTFTETRRPSSSASVAEKPPVVATTKVFPVDEGRGLPKGKRMMSSFFSMVAVMLVLDSGIRPGGNPAGCPPGRWSGVRVVQSVTV